MKLTIEGTKEEIASVLAAIKKEESPEALPFKIEKSAGRETIPDYSINGIKLC